MEKRTSGYGLLSSMRACSISMPFSALPVAMAASTSFSSSMGMLGSSLCAFSNCWRCLRVSTPDASASTGPEMGVISSVSWRLRKIAGTAMAGSQTVCGSSMGALGSCRRCCGRRRRRRLASGRRLVGVGAGSRRRRRRRYRRCCSRHREEEPRSRKLRDAVDACACNSEGVSGSLGFPGLAWLGFWSIASPRADWDQVAQACTGHGGHGLRCGAPYGVPWNAVRVRMCANLAGRGLITVVLWEWCGC